MKVIVAISAIISSFLCVGGAVAEDIGTVQDQWMACLNSTYTINSTQRGDPAVLADKAFQACASEEEQLWQMSASAGVPREAFDNLKAAMKEVLLQNR